MSFLTWPVLAESLQSPESLRAAVLSHLQAQAPAAVKGRIQVEVGAIDPRLRLRACTVPLQTGIPNGASVIGNLTVGVRCESPAWSVYVPARVEVHDRIVIVNRALARGALLGADDVEVVEQDVTRYAGGYYTDPSAVLGRVLRRPVVPGTAVAPGLIQEPHLVRRGERIVLLARTAGMEVRMEGEALENGGRGEQIRTRNVRSRREVQGTVVGPGTVEVRL